MSYSQTPNVNVFVDFIPAELKENKTWEIVYYIKHPLTNRLVRKRNRVTPLKSITNRRIIAKQMIKNINQRLHEGWNPFHQNKDANEYQTLIKASSVYFKRIEKEYQDENLRFDTYKTIKSQINLLKEYLINILDKEDLICFKFDNEFVGQYLDYVRYEKGLSPRTRDNYLGFLCTFSNFLLQKKYITINPTDNFSRINKKKKTRTIIDNETKTKIFDYWENENKYYLVLSLVCYFCLVRRTEITKIRVKDINLNNQTLFIDSSDSKNRKSAFVTIPDQLCSLLLNHIEGKSKEYYIFSNDNFSSGPNKVNPDIITKFWAKMRKALNIPHTIHWYSLKDTGITDLLLANVPLISVRDQARHFSSIQTDSYTPREMKTGDTNIKISNIKFN